MIIKNKIIYNDEQFNYKIEENLITISKDGYIDKLLKIFFENRAKLNLIKNICDLIIKNSDLEYDSYVINSQLLVSTNDTPSIYRYLIKKDLFICISCLTTPALIRIITLGNTRIIVHMTDKDLYKRYRAIEILECKSNDTDINIDDFIPKDMVETPIIILTDLCFYGCNVKTLKIVKLKKCIKVMDFALDMSNINFLNINKNSSVDLGYESFNKSSLKAFISDNYEISLYYGINNEYKLNAFVMKNVDVLDNSKIKNDFIIYNFFKDDGPLYINLSIKNNYMNYDLIYNEEEEHKFDMDYKIDKVTNLRYLLINYTDFKIINLESALSAVGLFEHIDLKVRVKSVPLYIMKVLTSFYKKHVTSINDIPFIVFN